MAKVVIKGGKRWKNEVLSDNVCMEAELEGSKDYTYELEENDLILNGFVDYHGHLWAPRAGLSVPSDQLLSTGYICIGDGGSFGMNDWDAANLFWDNAVQFERRAFMYLLPEGQTVAPQPNKNPTHPYQIDRDKMVEFINARKHHKYLGIKVQLGDYSRDFDIALMEVTRDICDRTGSNFMAHVTNLYLTPEEFFAYCKPGDVVAHYTQNKQNVFADKDGNVPQCVIDAYNRGVLFDPAHGSRHFSWDIFEKLYAKGIKPCGLSTDTSIITWHRMVPFEFSYMFSQFASASVLGLEGALKCATTTAAKHLNFDYENYPGVLILKRYDKHKLYPDNNGGYRSGFFYYRPMFFANKGKVIVDHDIPDPAQWGVKLP